MAVTPNIPVSNVATSVANDELAQLRAVGLLPSSINADDYQNCRMNIARQVRIDNDCKPPTDSSQAFYNGGPNVISFLRESNTDDYKKSLRNLNFAEIADAILKGLHKQNRLPICAVSKPAIQFVSLGPGAASEELELLRHLQQATLISSVNYIELSPQFLCNATAITKEKFFGLSVNYQLGDILNPNCYKNFQNSHLPKVIVSFGGTLGNLGEESQFFKAIPAKRGDVLMIHASNVVIPDPRLENPLPLGFAVDSKHEQAAFYLNGVKNINPKLSTGIYIQSTVDTLKSEVPGGYTFVYKIYAERDLQSREEPLLTEMITRYQPELLAAFAQKHGFKMVQILRYGTRAFVLVLVKR